MFSFLSEYLWTLFTLVGFGLAGGFVVIPFRNALKFPFFAAPLAGILVTVLGVSVIYNLFNLTLAHSAIISLCLCLITTIVTFFYTRQELPKLNLITLVFAATVIAFISYITNYTTITLGHPGFLYMDGTDHLGYAHLADWLNNHLATERPTTSPLLPYQSFPSLLFEVDQRFGSFFYLGIIADLRNLTGMFAYDFACGVILSATTLAISAVFAYSSFTFILLLVGLLTCHWFDYSRAGYLGKILSYPSSFFTTALFLIATRPFTIPTIVILAVLTIACTIMHSCFSTIFPLLIIGFTFIIVQAIYTKPPKKNIQFSPVRDNIFILSLLIGISISTSGILAHPINISLYPKLNLTWDWLLPRMFELENFGPVVTTLTSNQLVNAFILSSLFALSFLTIGIWKKESIATSLLAGPLLFLILLIFINAKSEIYQLIGTFYPWILCSGIILLKGIESHKNKSRLYQALPGFTRLYQAL